MCLYSFTIPIVFKVFSLTLTRVRVFFCKQNAKKNYKVREIHTNQTCAASAFLLHLFEQSPPLEWNVGFVLMVLRHSKRCRPKILSNSKFK